MVVEILIYLFMFSFLYLAFYVILGLFPWAPYWLPVLMAFIITTSFFIIFFFTDVLRKQRVRYMIYRNRLMRFAKHLIHDALYIVRISMLLRLIGYFIVFILVLGGAIYAVYLLYNQFIVPSVGHSLNLEPISFSVESVSGMLFSRRMNPLYAIGFLFGMAMSAFMRPKLEKFVEKVKTKKTVIYVFGMNEITRKFVESLCEFGFGPLVALIAERQKPWMDEYKAKIDLLVLDDPDILKDPTVYKRIGFKNALKVLILTDDKEYAQHILLNVRKNNPSTEIILLSRNKPPILDVVGGFLENIRIIDDIDITNRELIRQISLGFMHANAVETMVPDPYIGKSPSDLENDFNKRLRVLAVRRMDKIMLPEKFERGDILILYLVDPKALQEFLQLLPISPFEEYKLIEQPKKEERVEKEQAEEEAPEGGEGEDRDKTPKEIWGI